MNTYKFTLILSVLSLVWATGCAVPAATAQPYIEDETANFSLTLTQRAQFTHASWREYGGKLEAALAHENAGVRQAAMRGIIQHGDQFSVARETVWSLVRAYRDGQDTNSRRMAIVAIASTHDDWALDFLERSLKFEKSGVLRHTLAAVLFDAGRIGFGQSLNSN